MKYIFIQILIVLLTIEDASGHSIIDKGNDKHTDSIEFYYSLRIDMFDLVEGDGLNHVISINACIEEDSNCSSFSKISYTYEEIEGGEIPLMERAPIDTVLIDLSPYQLKEIFNFSRSLFGVEDSIDIFSRPEIYDMDYDGSYAVVTLELPGSTTYLQSQISFAVETRYQLGLMKLLEYIKEIENGL